MLNFHYIFATIGEGIVKVKTMNRIKKKSTAQIKTAHRTTHRAETLGLKKGLLKKGFSTHTRIQAGIGLFGI
ncbi:MAG: hypothetical protein DRR19_11270 [Candidatus Parabeggiatoa sp. nov. 1]|nr:MAG: hypothetical protein DRR19_11270 [Gammaproteobacteria bacterium]